MWSENEVERENNKSDLRGSADLFLVKTLGVLIHLLVLYNPYNGPVMTYATQFSTKLKLGDFTLDGGHFTITE